MNNKIDNKNKFKSAKQVDESLEVKNKRYQDLVADDVINPPITNSYSPVKVKDKQVTFLLEPDLHYQMTQIITYRRRFEGENITQAKFITNLLEKELKRSYSTAEKVLNSHSKNN